MARDFVLEIGVEEIPAKFLPATIEQLAEKGRTLLEENALEFRNVTAFATPRRLVFYVTGIELQQKDVTVEARGPALRTAYDQQGRPTQAAIGFARSQGVAVEDLVTRETTGGSYVYAVKLVQGRPAAEVLAGLLPKLIASLEFPKSMRWADKEVRFARPIRWLLALLGEQVVSFEYAGLNSTRISNGHRILGGRVEVAAAEEYLQSLRNAYVIVDHRERRDLIRKQVEAVAHSQRGKVNIDEDLLEEITFLVEYPTAFAGSFSADYLALPPEVLITSMREHQRYFPVVRPDGSLMPFFIAVRNGDEEYLDIVRAGNEKVLRARLADARFFYNEDCKTPLIERVEQLKGVVFQDKLGTMYDKVGRIRKLTAKIATMLGTSAEVAVLADRAALLAKADLTTNMVKEFPELQGIMGREYSKVQGEDVRVAQGIFEHYLPRFAKDALPESEVGILVGLADRLDSLVGYVSAGIRVSGSQDPYGLRRLAYGLVNIIWAARLPLVWSELVMAAQEGYDFLKVDGAKVRQEVKDFLLGRVRVLFAEKGIRHDVIEAVLASKEDSVTEAWERAQALTTLLKDSVAEDVLTAFRRVANLANRAEDGHLEPELFEPGPERDLYNQFELVEKKAAAEVRDKDYEAFFATVATLKPYIDSYLDGVLIMAEDPAIRRNRLALLKNISSLFLSVADLSKLSG